MDKWSKIIYIFIIVIVIVVGACSLYFTYKENSLIDFSMHFNGILMPILTAINVIVFIQLTRSIEKERANREKLELQHQQELQKATLRFEEINKLNNSLESTFKNVEKVKEGLPPTISKALQSIRAFNHCFETLFNLDCKRKITFDMALMTIENALCDLQCEGYDSMYALDKAKASKMHILKDDVIQALYNVAFGKDEKWYPEDYELMGIKKDVAK